MKKGWIVNEYGSPDSLNLEEIPSVAPETGEIRVAVKACGLNFPDTLTIRGKDQYKPELPFSPGAEFSGEVVEVGVEVTDFKVGDRVFGGTVWGSMREEITLPTYNVHHIPEGMDYQTAAIFPVTYGTAYHCLVNRAQIQSGETLAVLGASGGVGMAVIQVGKALGARVIACASTDEKLAKCKEFGADHFVNYSNDDIKIALKTLTDGRGVDVVCDPVGGKYSESALRATAWGGRFMVVGFTIGEIARIPLNLPLLKGNSIVGVFWSTFARRFPQINKENFRQLAELWKEDKLQPSIYANYPFEEAPKAFEDIEERRVSGKVVITMDPSI